MSTFMLRTEDVNRKWYVIDAAGKTLGKVAVTAATILNGKHKPEYTPHVDCGDCVIVINAEKVVLTGKKLEQKTYYHHSGYVGGLKAVKYSTNANVKANYIPSESSSELYTIKVKRVVDGAPLDDGYDFVQYAKAGATTLAVPPASDATFSSFEGAEVVDGKVTVSGDLELIANYTSKNGTVNFDLDLDKYAVGTSKKSSGSSSPALDGNYAIGNDWNTLTTLIFSPMLPELSTALYITSNLPKLIPEGAFKTIYFVIGPS